MTIDEAIKHAEEVAEEEEKQAIWLQYRGNPNYQNCVERAKKQRQFAEWLKDYKRLLEQEPILDKIRAEIQEKGFNSPLMNPIFTMTEIIDIIDKYKESEE